MVGIDWREQQQGVIDYIRSRGYFVVDSEPTREIMTQHARVALVKRDELGYNAVRTPMDLPIAKEVIRAVENARGDVVLLPTMGGSVPLGAMERAAQTHTITMPIANYDDNQHTANENLRLKICGTVWERWLRCWRWNNHLESPIMDRVRCVLSAFVLTAGAASQIGHAPVALQSCSVPGVDRSARCGAIEVLENPDQPRSRKLEIHFAVISATKGHARPDPIVPLLGGPGEAAIETGQMFVERLAPMLNDRDLLLVDQRGAGQSGALRCHFFTPDDPVESLQNLFPPACVESCAKGLATHADLTQYSYRRFADDLEKVRRTLGYGPLNLFAGSYGTRAAQVFVRAYPSSVRTIYLGSVVPIDIAQPLPFAKAAQWTLDRTLAACDADPACHSAFPRVRDEFSQIMEGLASGRVFVKVPGHEGTVALSQGRVAEWFRSLLYRPSSAAGLPWLIDRASKGDWAPIVKGILEDERDADSGLALGCCCPLRVAMTCPLCTRRKWQLRPETRS